MEIFSGDDDDKVKQLPVRFKNPAPEDRTLMRPYEVDKGGGCSHFMVHYIIDEKLAEVECGGCGAKLNPMWVLGQLANMDRRYEEGQKRYQEEMKRLDERERTKCQNCGKMTRISRR
jgi:hypothetical protein